MEKKKTHWKKLDNPNYLGCYSLMDGEEREITVTIQKVVQEEVKNERGSESCKVAYFKENVKPMILNTTNSKTIEEIYQTPYIEDWKGQKITIYIARFKAFGSDTTGLRIRKQKPQKPEFTPSHKKWDGAVKALKENNITIDDIEVNFRISDENKNLLIEQSR